MPFNLSVDARVKSKLPPLRNKAPTDHLAGSLICASHLHGCTLHGCPCFAVDRAAESEVPIQYPDDDVQVVEDLKPICLARQ